MGKKINQNEDIYATDFQWYGASVAGTDDYAVTMGGVGTSYEVGRVYVFKADVANTGACTLNINSIGAVAIKRNASADLTTGDIEAGRLVAVVFDGTYFQIVRGLLTEADQNINGIKNFTSPVSFPSQIQKFLAVQAINAGQPVSLSQFAQADGGIKYDNKGTNYANYQSASGSFTVGNNANRILIAFTFCPDTNATLAYNGQAFTQIDKTQVGGGGYVASWYLVAPATGAYTIALSGSFANNYPKIVVHSFYNAAQASPVDAHGVVASASNNVLTGTLTTGVAGALAIVGHGISASSMSAISVTYNGIAMINGQFDTTGMPNGPGGLGDAHSVIIGAAQALSITSTISYGGSPTSAMCMLSIKPYSTCTNGLLPASAANPLLAPMQFIGFARANIAAGNSGDVILNGMITGLSSLTIGSQHYVQDTSGTIGTTPGTLQIPCGLAISSTILLFNPFTQASGNFLGSQSLASGANTINAGIQNFWKFCVISISSTTSGYGAIGGDIIIYKVGKTSGSISQFISGPNTLSISVSVSGGVINVSLSVASLSAATAYFFT